MVYHLYLVTVFPVPLAVYLAIRRTEGSLSPIAFVGLLTADLLFLFGVSTEVFATTALFALIAFGLALAFGAPHRAVLFRTGAADRRRLPGHRAALAPLLDRGIAQPTDRGAPPGRSDRGRPRGLGVPREHTWIGGERFTSITQRFSAAAEEDGGYIGIAGLAVLVGFAITERRRRRPGRC